MVRARELLLLGRKLSGTEAADWGAIHQAVPAGVLNEAVDEVVRTLATGPTVSLGLWQNFGERDPFDRQREILLHAFDRGITHLDLANNYGPPPGSAEASLGRVLAEDLRPYRDELVISTKAGYRQWPGPYGEGGSRAYLLRSLDQSLRRLGLDHVDVFYSHRYDPDTPLHETLGALKTAVTPAERSTRGSRRTPRSGRSRR